MLWVSISVKAVNPPVGAINPGKKYRKLCNTVTLGLCLNKGRRDTPTIFGEFIHLFCTFAASLMPVPPIWCLPIYVFDFAAIVCIDRLLRGSVLALIVYAKANNC